MSPKSDIGWEDDMHETKISGLWIWHETGRA